jgi:DNA-binding response OmpR family regulator
MEAACSHEDYVDERTIANHSAKFRAVDDRCDLIGTTYGVGYRLQLP